MQLSVCQGWLHIGVFFVRRRCRFGGCTPFVQTENIASPEVARLASLPGIDQF